MAVDDRRIGGTISCGFGERSAEFDRLSFAFANSSGGATVDVFRSLPGFLEGFGTNSTSGKSFAKDFLRSIFVISWSMESKLTQ